MASPTKGSVKLAALVASFGLLALGSAHAAEPSAFGIEPQFRYEQPSSTVWGSPSVFSARRVLPGARLSLSQYYSQWEGRILDMREGILSFSPNEESLFWYSGQRFDAKGRNRSNTFDVTSQSLGARVNVVRPDDQGYGGLAVQAEYLMPGDGTARTSNSRATFRGPQIFMVGLNYSPEGMDYQGSYTRVTGRGGGSGDVFAAAAGRTSDSSARLNTRFEGHAIAERTSIVGGRTEWSFRPVLYGAVQYSVTDWFAVEGDLSVMPAGMPLAYGRTTSATSFHVYNPGGAMDGLRRSFVAIGSIKLLFHTRF
jgi:hypothetical protein